MTSEDLVVHKLVDSVAASCYLAGAMKNQALPEVIDPFESLHGYTTEQLRTINAISAELMLTS